MGTKETRYLQSKIKELIKHLGWSQKRLGREVYLSIYDDEDEDEISRMEEKVKKILSRSTTKHEVIEQYFSIIAKHPEFIKLQRVIPCYVSTRELEPQLEQEMKIISKSITQLVKEK